MLFLKPNFQIGSTIKVLSHLLILYQSNYLLICSKTKVGKELLCVIFEVKNPKDVSPGQDSKHFHEFICRLDMDGGLKDSPLVYNIPKEKFHGGSFGLWLFISHERFREYLNERSCISPLIKTNSQDIEIKMCSARVLYETDMAEFVEELSQETFGSPDYLCLREKKFITDHMGNSQYVDEVESSQSNGQNESNPRLKTQFKSLLSKLYQVSSYASLNS